MLTLIWFVIPLLVVFELAGLHKKSPNRLGSRNLCFLLKRAVFCWKELFGCIWDWVLRIFCATIVVTFFSEIFFSMPLVDVCLKLNYVNLYVPHVVYLFISILHTSSIMDHTHNTHRDHQKSINITTMIKFWLLSQSTTLAADHIEIHISMKLDVCFITFLWKT